MHILFQVYVNPWAIHLKLTQHCKATILQFKKHRLYIFKIEMKKNREYLLTHLKKTINYVLMYFYEK